jgi:DNA/RNA endonuclease YhcR with UshA esterase domain
MVLKTLVVSAVLSFVMAKGMWAQSNAAVAGNVQDTSGAIMPSVAVELTNELTGLQWTAQSDAAGRFSINRLPVGEYRLRAKRDGFKGFVTEAFRLDADQVRTVEVTLSVGTAAESVTVTGTVSQVETVSGVIRQVVDEKRITELPLNGRNPIQLVLLVPGAVTAPAASSLSANGGIAVNGARGGSTNYLLDGRKASPQ